MKAIQVDGEDLVWADFAPSDCTAGAVKIRDSNVKSKHETICSNIEIH